MSDGHEAKRPPQEASRPLPAPEPDRAEGEAIRRAQRLEGMGRLAAGVAHEYRNLLMGVMGCAAMALERLETDPASVAALIEDVRTAAERGAGLADQLLAFSRGPQEGGGRAIPADAALSDFERLLRPLVAAEVDLRVRPGAPGVQVPGAGELQQILLNLVLNACDAMPRGGALELASDVVRREEAGPDAGELPSDLVARVRVRDTGVGMDDETLRRAFEPFFTTKEAERGTGLGLSAVYALVRALGGAVRLESAPGQGTTATVLLPVVEVVADEERPGAPIVGARRILVVEDDPLVRRAVEHYLEPLGGEVRSVGDAAGARQALERPVDVLVTDLVLPDGAGVDLAREARARYPEARAILVSAYPVDQLRAEGRVSEEETVLGKPFDQAALLDAVRGALGSQGG